MKLSTFVVAALFVVPSHLAAQVERPVVHQQTSAVTTGRYEVIQSSLGALLTFRLDRYAGYVSQLVWTKDSTTVWQDTPVLDRPTISNPTKARFQIFTSGLGARYTFLLDVDTGKTWQLVSGKAKGNDGKEFEYTGWEPFEKQ